jgi:hypothetical protein
MKEKPIKTSSSDLSSAPSFQAKSPTYEPDNPRSKSESEPTRAAWQKYCECRMQHFATGR